MTPSEQFVARLCAKTFLSPWSIVSPRGKEAGKELCDVLVVCDPDVIVISVKEVEYKPTENTTTGMQRWTTRAVDASIKQVHGAVRLLDRLDRVVANDGAEWLYLPALERRRTHRIAVALGSKGEIPISDGRPGEPFVHVFDEPALTTIMTELDTITDFVAFLSQTETFLEKTQVIVPGSENMLGFYLEHGRQYPVDAGLLILDEDIWARFSSSPEFVNKKEADKESYLWDQLIEHIAHDHDPSLTETVGDINDRNPPVERVVRIMARENRFSRRMLAGAFREFHQGRQTKARMVQSPSSVVYVFLAGPHDKDRQLRRKALLGRMFIARGSFPTSRVVVGLATEEYDPSKGSSLDTAAYIKQEWTEDDQATMERMKREGGAFVNPLTTEVRHEEYPSK